MAARVAATSLGRELREFNPEPTSLYRDVESVRKELDRAAQELAFVRSRNRNEGAVTSPTVAAGPPPATQRPGPAWRIGAVQTTGTAATDPGAGPYHQFTAARYNRVVGGLRAGRRRFVSLTVLFSVGISTGLVVLTILARAPNPPIWLAALPLVWMIPVPFFVLSFRGTHRVLSQNPLEVAEVP